MAPLSIVFLTGLFATIAMIALMYGMVWKGFRHGGMIRDLGARFVSRGNHVFLAGIIAYLLGGIATSLPYHYILGALQFDGVLPSAGFGLFLGAIQGFFFTYFFVNVDAGEPSSTLRRRFFLPITFTYWFGHVGYGFAQGGLIGAFMSYGEKGLLWAGGIILAGAALVYLLAKKT